VARRSANRRSPPRRRGGRRGWEARDACRGLGTGSRTGVRRDHVIGRSGDRGAALGFGSILGCAFAAVFGDGLAAWATRSRSGVHRGGNGSRLAGGSGSSGAKTKVGSRGRMVDDIRDNGLFLRQRLRSVLRQMGRGDGGLGIGYRGWRLRSQASRTHPPSGDVRHARSRLVEAARDKKPERSRAKNRAALIMAPSPEAHRMAAGRVGERRAFQARGSVQ
jgi:hypothetical protein